MNERIRELAEQAAGEDFQTFGCGMLISQAKIELFAELIVQECVKVMHDNELWNRHISHVLTEHFRVEE